MKEVEFRAFQGTGADDVETVYRMSAKIQQKNYVKRIVVSSTRVSTAIGVWNPKIPVPSEDDVPTFKPLADGIFERLDRSFSLTYFRVVAGVVKPMSMKTAIRAVVDRDIEKRHVGKLEVTVFEDRRRYRVERVVERMLRTFLPASVNGTKIVAELGDAKTKLQASSERVCVGTYTGLTRRPVLANEHRVKASLARVIATASTIGALDLGDFLPLDFKPTKTKGILRVRGVLGGRHAEIGVRYVALHPDVAGAVVVAKTLKGVAQSVLSDRRKARARLREFQQIRIDEDEAWVEMMVERDRAEIAAMSVRPAEDIEAIEAMLG